ncbi:MAG: hypothetical protein KDA93_07545 [Planctomycetaceae bacterium]|nr:hypothetical protein [Planctomycetaceae bacterium]
MLVTRFPLLITLVCLSIHAMALADDSTEPPLTYTLEVDGKKFLLNADKTVILKGSFNNPKVTLRASETRRFEQDDIAFNYPANFTFEADLSDPDVRTWTMSGNNVTLMLFGFDGPVTPTELINSTAQTLKTTVEQLKPTSLKLGSLTSEGQTASLTLGEASLSYTVVTIPTAEGKGRLLVVQDVPGDDGKPSEEFTTVVKMLEESFSKKP